MQEHALASLRDLEQGANLLRAPALDIRSVITWRWLTGKGGDRLRDLAECLRGERATEGEDHARASGIIRRAAALAVRNVVRAAVSTGAMKSSTAISASAIP